MLQICTGKLFIREIEYQNNLKGIIYTNYNLFSDQKIETKAGTISFAENSNGPSTILYEIEELIEATGNGPGVIASHGIRSLILDFSTILSFVLNCTASPSYSLTERLLSEQPGVSTHTSPNKMIKKVFDKHIFYEENDENELIKITNQIIGLKRKTFLGVMSSIRTYVTGMHRISDDFELAYTLLVASIESLAQKFDGHQSTWTDYEESKRKKIDKALAGADQTIKNDVRNAILSIEHTSLARRFKDFALEHITSDFFRLEANDVINPITRSDLPIALSNAYIARSKYVHNLEKLPKNLTYSTYSETCNIESKTWLTLQGLSRLARHVIIEFIMRQPTVEKEEYNYHLERPNISVWNLGPECWIHHIDFSSGAGIQKLEGYLSQLEKFLTGVPNATVTEISNVLTEFETQINNIKLADRKAFLALYIIYNFYINKTQRLKNVEEFTAKHQKIILNPCTEGLIVYSLLNLPFPWEIEVHHDCLKKYFLERNQKLKIKCPQVIETGMLLQLAERYRKAGNETKALEQIVMAVENLPSHKDLRKFETDYKSSPRPINFSEILFSTPIDTISDD